VELMGGTIGATSTVGSGSCFWFELLLPVDPSASVAPVRVRAPRDARVLVVDDVPTSVQMMVAVLANAGYRVDAALDGDAALQRLRTALAAGDPYRAAVLDYRMPGRDGEEIARIVRADPPLAATSLILATSAASRGDAARFHAAGFNAYLTKPLRHDVLIEAVEEALSRAPGWSLDVPLITRHSLEELRSQRSAAADGPVARASDASSPMRVLLAEDNPVNQMVAVKMLERLRCRVDVVADGAEAVDMACRFAYDVIFMDVQMPHVDGHEATRRIRALPSSANTTRIIAMTANALSGDRERCLEAGMDDFVSKPISPIALREVLARASAVAAA
jgi:two-component system sensor histidine kinase/response regulator